MHIISKHTYVYINTCIYTCRFLIYQPDLTLPTSEALRDAGSAKNEAAAVMEDRIFDFVSCN